MAYVFDPAPMASVPVAGLAERFPKRRICLGHQCSEHGGDLPDFFSKPADALEEPGVTIGHPPSTPTLISQADLVVVLGDRP